jgi:hypothetical protein
MVASGSMNSTWRVMKSVTFMASVLSFILLFPWCFLAMAA